MIRYAPLHRPALVDASDRPITNLSWKPPQSGQFFGWMSSDGFSTVRVDSIQAIYPNPQRSDVHMLCLQYGTQMVINNLDAARLIKRLGWKEPESVNGNGR